VAAKFHPGRFSEFWGWPQDLFSDSTIALPDTDIGQQANLLHEVLDDIKTPERQAPALDQFFLRQAPQHPTSCPLVQSLIHHIYEHPELQSLQAAPHHTQLSLRHLRRLFKRYTGLNARTFIRIIRFYRAYFLLQSGCYTSLTDLALRAGYFDQAHFNHDFRNFTGYSPSGFMKAQHPEAALAWEGVR
jgi:AraC-like DNA-binding protein